MTDGNEQRRERRVTFSGFVRLRGLGEEQSVEAEIRNLSALGMFVASKRVPRPGASVFCRVILGNDRRIIKGKVAWVAPDSPTQRVGAGIEFVDLSRKDSEVLRQVLDISVQDVDALESNGQDGGARSPVPELATCSDSDNLGRVEVEFEDLPSPIKARARITDDGIVLTTKLPFLRVGSDVKVRFLPAEGSQAASRQGRLQAVSLGPTGDDGVPRLLVELLTPQPPQVDNEAGPPPPVRLELDTEPQALTLPLPSFRQRQQMQAAPEELTDPDITPVMHAMLPPASVQPEAGHEPSAPRDLGFEAAAIPQLLDIPIELASQPALALPLESEVVPEAPLAPAVAGVPEAAAAASTSSAATLEAGDYAVEVTVLPQRAAQAQVKQVNWSPSTTAAVSQSAAHASIEINLTPMPEPVERHLEQAAPLVLPPPPVSEPTMRVTSGHELSRPFSPNAQPRSQLPLKVLVGAAVSAVAVALLLWGGGEDTVGPPAATSAASADPQEQPAGIRIEPLAAAVSPLPPTPGKKPAAKPAAAAFQTEDWRPISDPSWPFTVAAEGQQTTVFVPLAGIFTGHRIYNVTQPNGVGAIFPQGQLSSHAGKFVVNEAGITQVWAEMRDNGLHVRVLFGRNVATHTATLETQGLRIVAIRR